MQISSFSFSFVILLCLSSLMLLLSLGSMAFHTRIILLTKVHLQQLSSHPRSRRLVFLFSNILIVFHMPDSILIRYLWLDFNLKLIFIILNQINYLQIMYVLYLRFSWRMLIIQPAPLSRFQSCQYLGCFQSWKYVLSDFHFHFQHR